MSKRIILIIILIVFSGKSIFAGVKLYLIPRINSKSDSITLEDIARIEGMTAAVNKIRGVKIGREIYLDGFIDRKELSDLLSSKIDEAIFIYGNAVRIAHNKTINNRVNANGDKLNHELTVMSGDRVTFVVVKNGIRIEVPGVAMRDGVIGDIIPVELRGSKSVKGKIITNRIVETDL